MAREVSKISQFSPNLMAPDFNFEKVGTFAAVAGLAVALFGGTLFFVHLSPEALQFLNLPAVKIGLAGGGTLLFVGSLSGLAIKIYRYRPEHDQMDKWIEKTIRPALNVAKTEVKQQELEKMKNLDRALSKQPRERNLDEITLIQGAFNSPILRSFCEKKYETKNFFQGLQEELNRDESTRWEQICSHVIECAKNYASMNSRVMDSAAIPWAGILAE